MAKTYEEMAEEALALESVPSTCDSDPICAAIVAKLKAKDPKADESALWAQAREIYWRYRDAEHEKEESTAEVMDSDSPSSVMD